MESSLESQMPGHANRAADGSPAPVPDAGVQDDLAFLARAVVELSQLPLRADVYRRIGALVHQAVGPAIVTVQSYDAATNRLEVRALVGIAGILDGLAGILGGHPVGMTFEVSEEARLGLGQGRLVSLPGGIYDLSFGAIPRPICGAMERLIDLRGTLVIGLCAGTEILGSIAIGHRGAAVAPNPLLIEALARHAAVVMQRRKAVAACRESEARYRLLAEHATDVVWTSDLHLRFTYISASVRHLLGYTPDEVMSLPLRQILPPASLALVRGVLAEELAQERRRPNDPGHTQRVVEMEVLRKDGTTIWIGVRGEFACDPEGNPVGILATTRDITDLKRHEQERRVAETRALRTQNIRFLSRLAASVGREVTAPVAGASEGIAQALALLDDTSGPRPPLEQAREHMAQALLLGRRLSQCERGDPPALASLDIPDLVADVLALLGPRLPAEIGARHAVAGGLPPISADRARLRQALVTLTAAILATVGSEEGVVDVTAEEVEVGTTRLARTYLDNALEPGACISLRIALPAVPTPGTDPNEVLDKILGSASIAGLEAAAALGVIENHGGNILVSCGPREPLTLAVLLPAARPAGELPPAGDARGASEESNGAGCGTVLVADADIGARWLAKSALEKAGLTVLTAQSTPAAVEALRCAQEPVGVVLLDAALPPAGAEAALRDLRAVCPEAAVILSSPFGEEPSNLAEGVAGLVQKPYLPKLLVKAVRDALQG